MSKHAIPETFAESMAIARGITWQDQERPDDRKDFDVYLDVAKIQKSEDLLHQMTDLPVSDFTKKEVIDSEAYGLAYDAYLNDAHEYKATRLNSMLGKLSVFS
ncbi:MAG: hypothetical protein ACXWLH_01755 [Candidatus Saccharimonadales bacterium]